MKFEHFIITPFCFRGKKAFNRLYWPGQNFQMNPLDKKFLVQRLKLFEMLCLPGILSQTNQNFSWILIIDEDLPKSYKKKLNLLVKEKERVFFLEYKDSIRLEKTD